MNLHRQLEYFHGEHDEIHVALNAWEAALQRVESADDVERRKGLMQLREMKEQIRTSRFLTPGRLARKPRPVVKPR
jgi:hypothetical protein